MRLLGKYFSLRTKSTKKWWSQHFKAFSQSFQLKCQYQFSVKNIQVQYQLEKMTLCTARLPVLRIHLRAFDDFKNKQQKCMKKWFLICKSIYILKVYSKTYIEIKRKCWKNSSGQNKRYKKCTFFFLSRAPIHHGFDFNFRFLFELKHKVHSLEVCVVFSIFDSVSFLLKFIHLFKKEHGFFHFKTS